MARPRSNNKPQRKGSGTSFGKRSDAEKSYRKKGSSSRSDDDSKRSFGKPSGFRKSTGSSYGSSSDKPEFRKSSRPSSGSRPDRSNDRGDKEGFRPRAEGTRSYNKPSYGKPSSERSFRSSDRSEKRPFSQDAPDNERPKRSAPYDDQKSERAPRAERPDIRKEFKKPEGFHRAERKDFKKPEGFTRRDSGSERSGDDSKKPFRKSGDFVKRTEGDFRNQRDDKSFGKEERKSFVKSRITTTADFTRPDRKAKSAPAPEEEKKSDGLTRLNKHIANSGVGSRRDADKLITMGLISVNGVTITELGTKVKAGDVVRYEDRILKAEKLVYILLNKPKGFITTTDDPQERSTVMGLVAGACKERIYPVGRLDRNTTGLLLLTNDGDLADKLTHPSYKAKKVYKVELDKPLTKNDYQKVQEGVRLEEGRAMVDDVAIISDDGKTVGLEIHIGWNRVVRRIFETLGYDVVKLDRSVYAGLDKKDTPRGNWRFLKPEEIVMLKHFK